LILTCDILNINIHPGKHLISKMTYNVLSGTLHHAVLYYFRKTTTSQ